MTIKIRKKYDEYTLKKGFTFSEPSRTVQSFRDGTFIESYLRKYNLTGVLGDPNRLAQARYGDFADLPSFQESANRVAATTQFFESLPSQIRERFGNSVATFVAYASDPANVKELTDLGIFVRENPEGENHGISAQQVPQEQVEKVSPEVTPANSTPTPS